MNLIGANPESKIISDGKSKGYDQYYNRNALNIHSFKKIYPGIDWGIYTSKNSVKYDFIVHPGSNPNQIQMKFKHHEGIKLNKDGSFTLTNRMGSITELAPSSFQGDFSVKTSFVSQNNPIPYIYINKLHPE